jgi:hypothetical protein
VEGTHQVLLDTGETSRVSVFKFLSDTQTGELPHWGRSAPGGLLSPGPGGTAVTAPLIAPVIPSGPARYGWCQNKEA